MRLDMGRAETVFFSVLDCSDTGVRYVPRVCLCAIVIPAACYKKGAAGPDLYVSVQLTVPTAGSISLWGMSPIAVTSQTLCLSIYATIFNIKHMVLRQYTNIYIYNHTLCMCISGITHTVTMV